MILQILIAFVAILYVISAGLALWKQWLENKTLKIRLRIALEDCRAFYEIEQRLCDALAISLRVDGPWRQSPTALSIKRSVREAIRKDGKLSPSNDSTPHQIAQRLAEL